jgi:hypothetical protein
MSRQFTPFFYILTQAIKMRICHPAILFGSTVVVIGTNGYMGIEACEKLLQAGFFVRGTVRDVEENRQCMYNLIDIKWPNMFELVHMSDFEAEGAFDEAFKGERTPFSALSRPELTRVSQAPRVLSMFQHRPYRMRTLQRW